VTAYVCAVGVESFPIHQDLSRLLVQRALVAQEDAVRLRKASHAMRQECRDMVASIHAYTKAATR
jgi:hypothetical protein